MTTEPDPPFAQLSDFAPWVEQVFHLSGPDGMQVEATLVEAKSVQTDTLQRTPRTAFSLLFKADESRELKQGTYLAEHPQAGRHRLFLTPVWMEEEGRFLEAVFN